MRAWLQTLLVAIGGVLLLYGLAPTLLAVAPFVGAQQASYDVLKMMLFAPPLALCLLVGVADSWAAPTGLPCDRDV